MSKLEATAKGGGNCYSGQAAYNKLLKMSKKWHW
jgi:hypothetical protein